MDAEGDGEEDGEEGGDVVHDDEDDVSGVPLGPCWPGCGPSVSLHATLLRRVSEHHHTVHSSLSTRDHTY